MAIGAVKAHKSIERIPTVSGFLQLMLDMIGHRTARRLRSVADGSEMRLEQG